MNLGELIDDCAAMTVRPDKEDLIRQKINAVVRMISLSGTYWRDLVEEVLSDHPDFKTNTNIQTLALPARFRKPAYIERDLSAINMTTGFLESRITNGLVYNRVDPRSTRREGRNVPNAYYTSGSNLLLRQEIGGEKVIWGYYQYPARMVAPNDSNWITELMPDLVTDYAGQFVMASLGDRDRTAGLAALAQVQLSVLIEDMLRDVDAYVGTGR